MTASSEKSISVGPARPRRARKRWTFPLGIVVALGILLLVAAPMAIVIFVNVGANRENTFSLTNNWSVLLIESVEREIRSQLDPAAGAFEVVGDMHQRGLLNLNDLPGVQKVLRGVSASLPSVEAVMVYRAGQVLTGVFRDPTGQIIEIEAQEIDSPGVRAALDEIGPGTEPQWGDLVVRQNAVFVNYAYPLVRDGQQEGILVFAMSLTILSEIMTDISNEFDTTAFVIVGTDRLLAHPNLTNGHPDISENTPTVMLSRVGDPIVEAFPEREWMEEFVSAREAGVEVTTVEIADEVYVIMYRTILDYGPEPWIIGAHFPVSQIGDEVARLFAVALVSLLSLLVVLILAFVAARLLARPVRRFANQAALITDLELDSVAPLPRSRIRELDNAATAFNAMLDGLRAFAAYVPKKLVSRLVHSGIKSTTRSSERELTIMFTDIAGFTSLAEHLPASEAAGLLNHHFSILGAIVERHGGTVDKFVGDGLMAFWGAPEPMPDHTAAACRAACEMIEAISSDNAMRTPSGWPELHMRVGIYSGPVIVGNIGSGTRINYTVVGDAVNTSQRLQDIARTADHEGDVTVFVGEGAMQSAGDGFVFEPAGEFDLRGRQATLRAFRLVGRQSRD